MAANSPITLYVPRKPPLEFTQERKEEYLEHIRETGLVYLSAERVGITSKTVNSHRKLDKAFDEACEEAMQCWVDNHLLSTARDRAIKGVTRPIIGGRFKDEVVAHEQVYSDTLMLAFMRAKRAEFRSNAEAAAAGGGSGGGVMIVPAAPTTLDDWEAQFGEAAKGQTGK